MKQRIPLSSIDKKHRRQTCSLNHLGESIQRSLKISRCSSYIPLCVHNMQRNIALIHRIWVHAIHEIMPALFRNSLLAKPTGTAHRVGANGERATHVEGGVVYNKLIVYILMHAKSISQQALLLNKIGKHLFALIGEHAVSFDCVKLGAGSWTVRCGA